MLSKSSCCLLHYYWTGLPSFYSQSWTSTPLADSLASTIYSLVLITVLLYSMTFHSYSAELSTLFSHILLLSRSLSEYIRPHTCTYFSLLICAICTCVISSLSWVTCSMAQPAFVFSPLCCTRACQAFDYLYKSTFYFEGLFAHLSQLSTMLA